MNLVLVHPDNLRQHWPRILSSLCAVRAKGDCDWIAEDVYHAIKAGSAACHVGMNPDYAGVLITTLPAAEFSGIKSLHIWIVHNAGEADVIDACLPMLRDLAAHAGAARITFSSSRKGWEKRFPVISTTYEIT